jgi:hypothetical protein
VGVFHASEKRNRRDLRKSKVLTIMMRKTQEVVNELDLVLDLEIDVKVENQEEISGTDLVPEIVVAIISQREMISVNVTVIDVVLLVWATGRILENPPAEPLIRIARSTLVAKIVTAIATEIGIENLIGIMSEMTVVVDRKSDTDHLNT